MWGSGVRDLKEEATLIGLAVSVSNAQVRRAHLCHLALSSAASPCVPLMGCRSHRPKRLLHCKSWTRQACSASSSRCAPRHRLLRSLTGCRRATRAPAPAQPLPKRATESNAVALLEAPKDVQQRIWELAHIIHDVFTANWPHKWARPPFAADMRCPAPEVWRGFPAQLGQSSEGTLKSKLEEWRALPDTAAPIREALAEMLQKLSEWADDVKQRQRQKKLQQRQQDAAQQAAQHHQLFVQVRLRREGRRCPTVHTVLFTPPVHRRRGWRCIRR